MLYLKEYKKEFAFLTKFHYFESRGEGGSIELSKTSKKNDVTYRFFKQSQVVF